MNTIEHFEKYETYRAVVIGTGASGYAAACRLRELGVDRICMITEGVRMGTSRNTGSDKQTYYKLSLGGSDPDSVQGMAETLFAGGCTDGDTALCEAALSTRCFFGLCEAGVPFPCNEYGEYRGYKTDHDPASRATSAGPLTSKFMTEALEKKANALQIPVFDHLLAVELLKDENGVTGVLCLDTESGSYVAFHTPHIVLATGGPGGIYRDSVYPKCHSGMSSLAILAEASLQNLTEWQYGLSSVEPRWNVSGTYMQVLPCLYSIDKKGTRREFLTEYFSDPYKALSALFLKGYQWPFDAKKVKDGSSVIDLLVYRETALRGRRVYLDYTRNPFGLEQIDFSSLDSEAENYLQKADACFGTPIERLQKMNAPAVELYKSHGVDLFRDPLEIALCAQHHNGGVAVDASWQTDVKGLYAIGECAGTHGITRPGGSALNAGQVGALRAAESIADSQRTPSPVDAFEEALEKLVVKHNTRYRPQKPLSNNAASCLEVAKELMSKWGGPIRMTHKLEELLMQVKGCRENFTICFSCTDLQGLVSLYRLRDALTVQEAVLTAMLDFAQRVGLSRGSALYCKDSSEEALFAPTVDENRTTCGEIQVLKWDNTAKKFDISTRPVRPIPNTDEAFETMWRGYRERRKG